MTLTTHGVVGAGVMAVCSTNPLLGAGLAFASHFVLDALPHLDYQILSLDHDVHLKSKTVKLKWGKTVLIDLLRIGTDFLLGLLGGLAVYYLTSVDLALILIGAILGMLPDLLQFVYGQVGGKVLGLIQRFHNFTHTKHRLENKFWLGVVSQLSLIGLVFILFNLYQ